MATPCPVCWGSHTDGIVRSFSLETVATYFVPASRWPDRHIKLKEALLNLWRGRNVVDIRKCSDCGFGFADPFVAGDADFYNLVTEGDPRYPHDRWEFQRTLQALRKIPGSPLRLLEPGAGDGQFVAHVRAQLGHRFDVTAVEYNEVALARLSASGVRTIEGSILDVTGSEVFDVICLFQTIEHMDRIDEGFAAMNRLLKPGGNAFISAPNQVSVEVEESVVGFSEMPPQHIGRWIRQAFDVMASRHGLVVVDYALEPPTTRLAQAYLFSVYRTIALAEVPHSLEQRINSLRFRIMRGALKRALALRWLPKMWSLSKTVSEHNQWVHLVKIVPPPV